MKVIYCHHVRRIRDLSYSESNFEHASNSLKGAAEMDSWAGIASMSIEHAVYRFEYSSSEGQARLINPQGKELGSWEFSTFTNFNLNYLSFWKSILTYGDLAIARNSTPENRLALNEASQLAGESIWWLDTPFLLGVVPKGVKIIVRSHNFEATHALGEVASPLKYLHFLLKWRSEQRIAKKWTVIPISPRDCELYKLNPTISPVLPLRQLPYIAALKSWTGITKNPWVYYSGASYKVLHNWKNSSFLIEKLAPRIADLCSIKIFGSGLPQSKPAQNVEILGFSNNFYSEILEARGAVVPYHGGAGMQSKVFEPLVLGIPLIADPRALAGFDFIAGQDYLACESLEEYASAVESVTSISPLRVTIASSGRKKALKMFSAESVREIQNHYLKKTHQVVGKDAEKRYNL